MIYTITFNPALDYMISVKDLQMGLTNRTEQEALVPGGKGINVSIVLKNLGLDSTALGFTAGFTGKEIERLLAEAGCRTEFIEIPQGFSRINVKIKNEDGTEINGKGPDIDPESLQRLLDRIGELKEGDVLVLAGSIPASIPDSVYSDICGMLAGRGVTIVVDATGELLRNVLPMKPFLIKPNHHELGELFGVRVKTAEEVIPYAQKLREQGAANVLVSMAGEGAVLCAADGSVHHCAAPEGKLVNAVGAGDSMVAGFLAGYLKTGDYGKAFRLGVAAGSASAFSEALATGEEVEALLKRMQ